MLSKIDMSNTYNCETNKVTEIVSEQLKHLRDCYKVSAFGSDNCVVYGVKGYSDAVVGHIIKLINGVAYVLSVGTFHVDGEDRICALVTEHE